MFKTKKMDTILVSSDNKGDTEFLLKLLKKMGVKTKVLSESEKEDYGLMAAMLEADRNQVVEESEIINKLEDKCK